MAGSLTIEVPTSSGLSIPLFTSTKMAEDTFVNYSNPQDFVDRKKRRQVASYIGVHFRNRSGPAAKRAKAKQRRNSPKSRFPEPEIESAPPDKPRLIAQAPPITIPNDGHGFRRDPFSSYPIEFEPSIPSAVDYCKCLLSLLGGLRGIRLCWLASKQCPSSH
jgi:hypothetical protein